MRKGLTESDLNAIIDSLKTKSDFDETLDIIDDNISHFEDQDGIVLDKYYLKSAIIEVEYMRKTRRKSSILLVDVDEEYEDNEELDLDLTDNQDSTKLTKRHSNFVNNFLDLLEIADKITLKISYHIHFSNQTDINYIGRALDYLKNISKTESMSGPTTYISRWSNRRYGRDYDPIDLKRKLIIHNDRPYVFEFSKELNIQNFKSDDPLDNLPKNIIDDFKKFAQRLNMKISDKAELVNLLSKADWDKKITTK